MWLACCAGCNNEPFTYVKVSGKVAYEDGTLIPADSIELWFVSEAPPVDAMTYPRPAKAGVNVTDGTFDSVTSHRYGDGLVVGKHKVAVFAYKNGAVSDLVPREFANAATSPLIVDTADAPLDIRIPRKE